MGHIRSLPQRFWWLLAFIVLLLALVTVRANRWQPVPGFDPYILPTLTTE